MNMPLIGINKIVSILDLWGKSKENDIAYYGATHAILLQLEEYADEHDLLTYTSEKLVNLQEALNAMFGADIDNAHSFEEHLSFAYTACQSLSSNHCFGESS